MSAESALRPGQNQGNNQPGVDFLALLEAIPGLCALVLPDDPRFTVVAANNPWLQAVGKSREEMVGSSLSEVVPPGSDPAHTATLENLYASFRQVLVTRKPDTMPVQRYHLPRPELAGGGPEVRYWSPVNSPLLGADGAVTHILHGMEDVTVRWQVEEALRSSKRESERLEAERQKQLDTFDTVLAPLQEFVYLLDPEGRFRYVNKPLLDLWGLTSEQAIGKDFAELGYPEELVRLHREQIRRVVENAQPVNGENSYTSPAGVTGHYEYTFVPLFHTNGSVEAVGGHTRDVTGNRQADAALRASEAKYRTLFESIDEGFCIIQMLFDERQRPVDFRYMELNPVFEQQTGLRDALGKTIRELAPDLEPSWFERYGNVARTGQPTRFVNHAEPLGRWFDVFAFRIGEPEEHRVAVLFKDITERRRSEEQLRKVTDRLEGAHAAAELGMWTWDVQADQWIADRNLAFLFGVDEPSAAGGLPAEHFIRRIHPDDQPVMRERLASALALGETYAIDYRVFGADGTERWVASRGRAKLDAGGRPQWLNGVVLDVTERKRAEEALRQSEERRGQLLQLIAAERERLHQVLAQAPVAVVVLRGRDFVIELANPLYQALLRKGELAGRRFADVMLDLEPDVWDVFHRVMETGEPYIAGESYIPYDSDRDGIPEDHWFNAVYNPLRELDGTVSGFVAVLTEVTTQVRARQELERVNQGLEEFAHVASHDLQEPLRMVNSYSQLLVRRLGQNATGEQKEFAGYIQHGVKRMQQLIRDLLAYSQTVHAAGELDTSEAGLDEALRQALTAVGTRLAETGATLTHDGLPTVRGDVTQLSHVFQNLLSNALKYRNRHEPPRIHLGAERRDGQWVVSVSDNGIGFEPDQAERIFGLFKRLHREDEYPGTGLGLAICKRIVERYGGKMWAQSEPGGGSTFFFSLPAVQS